MGIRYQNRFAAALVKMILVLFFLSVFLSTNYVQALTTGLDKAFDTTDPNSPLKTVAEKGANFNTTATFEGIVGLVITTVLGLLGVIFLVLAIYGGYNWLTARGNEEMVEKAKETITNAVIGLVVVLAAYAISRFVVSALGGMTLK